LYFTWPKDAARSISVPGEPTSVVAVSADGQWVASESLAKSPPQVKIWSRSADGAIAKKPVLTVSVARLFVMATAFSADGKFLAVVAQDNDHPANCTGPGDLTILEVASGRRCLEVHGMPGQDGALDCVAFSRDGTKVATAFVDQTVLTSRSKRLVRIRSVDTGAVVLTLEGHQDGVSSLAFSPDGTRLASASQDGTVKVCDLNSGAELYSIASRQGFPHQVEFSPDGRLLAACDSLGVKIWNADKGAVVMSVQDFETSDCLAFSPDSRYLAAGGEDAKIWDVSSRTVVETLRRGLFSSTEHLELIAFSADGKTLLATSGDELIVWQVKFDKAVRSSHP
jgi:WD40 repeat protein